MLLVLASAPLAASAQVRAWLDRDRVAVGETTTLNIETTEATADAPDYSALQRDFDLAGNTSSRQVEIGNGSARSRLLFAVALQPKRDGLLTIAPLQIGSQRTPPLSLTVIAAAPARTGGPAFIEAEADDDSPYVQQAVGYTLRLYYLGSILSGQLDQDAPDGASLQRLDNDTQFSQLLGGKRYTVVERKFLLIPERSGALTIPGARFQGRSVGGFFDDVFGDGQRALSATGAPRLLTVRAAPADAPQPWLPLRALSLRYLAAPQAARVGDAFEVVVEANADGANAAQLPDLQLPAIDGAQVFADPPRSDERLDGARPSVRLTRKFSIVPARAGALRIPGPRIAWWDVRAAAARTASVPDLDLQVAAAA
ncbi:MAG: BatD family protein, partial [Luteimonas sp.]